MLIDHLIEIPETIKYGLDDVLQCFLSLIALGNSMCKLRNYFTHCLRSYINCELLIQIVCSINCWCISILLITYIQFSQQKKFINNNQLRCYLTKNYMLPTFYCSTGPPSGSVLGLSFGFASLCNDLNSASSDKRRARMDNCRASLKFFKRQEARAR